MKRILLILLCGAMVLCLTACGASEPEPTPEVELTEIEPVLTDAETEAVSASDAAAPSEDIPPASATDIDLDEAAFAAAEACVGRTAQELYEAVGEPTGEVSYAASCLEENAEDGMLFYDELGFYVWTVRSDSGETVHAVYPLE